MKPCECELCNQVSFDVCDICDQKVKEGSTVEVDGKNVCEKCREE
jgi:hypothetical protein